MKTTRGKPPKERNARPCCHCGSGEHWDNECPHRNHKKAVRVHLASASADILEALDEYNAAQELEESEKELEPETSPEGLCENSENEESSD